MAKKNIETSGPRSGAMKTWLRVVLFASLALNLMVLGLVGGAVISKGGPSGPPSFERAFGPMTQALSSQDRRTIGNALRRDYKQKRANGPRDYRDFSIIINTLRQVPFDADGVVQNLEKHHLSANNRLMQGQELLIDRLVEMSDEERKAYATRLEEVVERRKKRGGRPPKRD